MIEAMASLNGRGIKDEFAELVTAKRVYHLRSLSRRRSG
jgi:hypothetical protein